MLHDFETKLRDLLNNQEKPRPFVCDGNPLECQIFIVGFNAATEMDASFWDFWSPERGFDKSAWMEAYIKERAEKTSTEKKRRTKISATRLRIEWMTEIFGLVHCLETNLYSKATKRAKDLRNEDKDCSVFTFLLKKIQPKVIFLHGAPTRKDFGSMFNITIEKDQMVEISLFGNETKVIAKQHLSLGWSKEKSIDFGKELLILL